MEPDYIKYRNNLFKVLLEEQHNDGFRVLIEELSSNGSSKKEIYDLFLNFFGEIQLDPRTRDNEEYYDRIADFMDGFTAWGKNFRILPDEPDV